MPERPIGAATSALVEEIAREAGVIALRHFRALGSLPVEQKGHLDLVTDADREVEDFITARLREIFPDDGILGEEHGGIAGHSQRIWVIDPIDGTFNFVRGGQNWAISIGLFDHCRPVFGIIHAPARALTLSGGDNVPARLNGALLPPLPVLDPAQGAVSFGMHPTIATSDRLEVMRFISDDLRMSFRSSGSATSSLIEVALGETDGYIAMGDSCWDVMAGLPILSSMGVSHTIDWNVVDLEDKLRFACGSPALIDRVRPLLNTVAPSARLQQ